MVSTRRGAAAAGEVASSTFSTPPDLKRKGRKRKALEPKPAAVQNVPASSSHPSHTSPLSNSNVNNKNITNNNASIITPSRNGNTATAASGTIHHQASTPKFSSLRGWEPSSSSTPSVAPLRASDSSSSLKPLRASLQGSFSHLTPVPTPFADFLESLNNPPAREPVATPASSTPATNRQLLTSSTTPAAASPLRHSETVSHSSPESTLTPVLASAFPVGHPSASSVTSPADTLAEVKRGGQVDQSDTQTTCPLSALRPCAACGDYLNADVENFKVLYSNLLAENSKLESENSRLQRQLAIKSSRTKTPSSQTRTQTPTQTPTQIQAQTPHQSPPPSQSQTPVPATPSQSLFSRIGASIATPFRRILTPRRPSTPAADPATISGSKPFNSPAKQGTPVKQTPSQGVKRARQSDSEVVSRDIKRSRQESSIESSTAVAQTTPIAKNKRLRQPETEPAKRDVKRARLESSTSPQASSSIQTPSTMPRSLSMYHRATRAELDARPFGARRAPFTCGQRNEIKKTWELHMRLFERRRTGSLPKEVDPQEYHARMKAQVEYKACQAKYPGYVARPAFCRAVMPLEGMASPYEEKPYLPSHRDRTVADPEYHQMLANYRELTGEEFPRQLPVPVQPVPVAEPTPSPPHFSSPLGPVLSTSPPVDQTPGRTFCVPDFSDTDDSLSDIESEVAPTSTTPPSVATVGRTSLPATAVGHTPPPASTIRRTPFATPVAPDGLSFITEEDATPVPARRETTVSQIQSASTTVGSALPASTKSGAAAAPVDPFFERFPTIDSLVDYYINADTSWVQEIGNEEVRILHSFNGSRRAEAEYFLDNEDPFEPLDAAGRERFIEWFSNVPEEDIMHCARLMME